MKLDIYKIDGKSSGKKIDVSKDIFGIEPNDHAIYLAVKTYLANQRQGTHKTKERGEVRGGGKEEAVPEPVQAVLLYGSAVEEFLDRVLKIIDRLFLKKLRALQENPRLVTN